MKLFLSFMLCFVSLHALSLEEKIAQMLMIGFKGTTLTPQNPIYEDIQKRKIGGVILFDYDIQTKSFGRNIQSFEQVTTLTSSLQNLSQTPLFIAIDYEGGRVNRLKERYGFAPTFSQAFLGQKNDLDFTFNETLQMAQLLSELGINLNFAPVVDVDINPDNPVIGALQRSYSSDANIITAHANEAIKAYKSHHIIATIKHFPGHGSSDKDSHLGVVNVSDSYDKSELIPYKKLIQADKVDAIMSAHVFNAKFDKEYPATLSKKTISGLLRDEFGFDGVVFSDDLQMDAIAKEYGLKQTLMLLINADIDVIVIGNNLGNYDPTLTQKVIETILELLDEGKIEQSQIETSYQRIMKLKNKLPLPLGI